MIDGNEQALNKHLEKQRQEEKFLEMFENDIQADLENIRVSIKRIRRLSKDFYGYDFSESAEDFIQDLI